MQNNGATIKDILIARQEMMEKEKEIYLTSIENINSKLYDVLDNNIGSSFVTNIAKDLSGEVVRRYFDMGDFYITVDQFYNRIANFNYDNDNDVLKSDENLKKNFYNFSDSITSESMQSIISNAENARRKLFQDNRQEDNYEKKRMKKYRESKTDSNGNIFDELTGEKGRKDGKSDMHVDHIQSRNAATYNSRYVNAEKLREFYNSDSNFEIMHASANTSKGDIRYVEIRNVDGSVERKGMSGKEFQARKSNVETIKDITTSSNTTAENMADAVCSQLEQNKNARGKEAVNKIKTLKEKGYLDENGKVKPNVKKEIEAKYRQSMNAESMNIIKHAKYGVVAKDAGKMVAKSAKKIIAGQILYYMLPAIVYETKTIVAQKNMNLDKFYLSFKVSGERIIKYTKKSLKDILANSINNSFNKFLKVFFDIIIDMLKETIKRIMKIVKEFTMTIVNCIKTLFDSTKTTAEKADAITRMIAMTVTTVVMDLLFEYIQKQFTLPDFLVEPLQIILTVLATNLVMLVLNKLDLFDVQYGLNVAKIEKIFDEETNNYIQQSNENYNDYVNRVTVQMQAIKDSLKTSLLNIREMNLYNDDVIPELENISRIFNMNIDFEKEWEKFLGINNEELLYNTKTTLSYINVYLLSSQENEKEDIFGELATI